MRARGGRGERGAAAVEFAILLPVLIAIVCGTIDWGYYFFQREILVNASREGARTGSLQGMTSTDAVTAAESYIKASLDLSRATVATNVNGSGGACPATPPTSCLRITYTTGGSVTGFLGSLVPTSIVAYAEMRR
jgi:Flp pilus assembly protein TadG